MQMNKRGFWWNMLGSGIYAAATILFVMIAKRCTGETAGAQFYMAFTTGQMLLTVGYFEMRPFQSTDVNFEYSAQDYFGFRTVTCILMMVGSILVAAVYAVLKQTPPEGVALILIVTLYKMFDAASDVFEGEFQRRERMELAGRSMFIRVLLAMAVFAVVCIASHNVLLASAAMLLAALAGLFCVDIPWMRRMETVRLRFDWQRIKTLFSSLLLLFLGSMMCMWIWNGTKYVVEWTMDAQATLIYGIIFMPTMVINLGSGFLFKPMLTTLARHFEARRWERFAKTIGILCGGVAAITAVVLLGAWLFGIPALSLIYAIDLKPYKRELLILLVGGGLNAMGIIFYYALTVMRSMKMIFTGYIVILLASVALPIYMTQQWGLTGSAVSYMILMGLLMIIFLIMTAAEMERLKRKDRELRSD